MIKTSRSLFLATLVCAFPQFSLNFFVQCTKYKAELHFYSISAPIQDELSTQEVNLSGDDEMMSWHWVCRMAFFTGMEGYLDGRRRAYSMVNEIQ